MPSKKKKTQDYDYQAAIKAGFSPDETGHWPSREPVSGKILKKPGHPTLYKSVEEDQRLGYQSVLRGSTLYSFERGDPRLRGGSVSAPRTRDLSGAVNQPRRRKRSQHEGATIY